MSSPNPSTAPAGPSKPTRPLGTAKPPAKAPTPAPQPGGGAPAQIPRRLAGTVPGIARAASNLRQSSTPSALGNPLASIPAHLRNFSASASTPKIPSPLGKGTPARTSKQNLPVRTSKTTERHVFLPEDPQLAPLPKSPMGSQVNLASMGPPRAMGQREKERREAAAAAHHATAAQGISVGQGSGDERSDAEKMTKREREEARLPRLTAYTTADAYRLKFLQAFLKREHGVYNLPLLPGYGASTSIRSSPAVKSPGGVSLLERMTQAEDLGYDDSYFPAAEDTERDPHISADNPSEYILSHSPPSPIAHMSMEEAEQRVQALREEHERERAHMDATIDGAERGQRLEEDAERDSPATEARSPSYRTIRPEDGHAMSPGPSPERRRGRRGSRASRESRESRESRIAELEGLEISDEEAQLRREAAERQSDSSLGTHLSPKHPGHLEHVPAPALSPDDLAPVHQHQRRLSNDQQQLHEHVVQHHLNDPNVSPTRTTDSMPDRETVVTDGDIESALHLDISPPPPSAPGLLRSISHSEPRVGAIEHQRLHAAPPYGPVPIYGRDHEQMHHEGREGRHVTLTSPISVPSPHPPSFNRSQTVPVRNRRRKSHSTTNQVAEAVFFSYGVSVFFGFQPDEEKMVMEDIDAAGCWVRGADEEDWEVEEFHYVYDGEAEYPRIYNDMFTFKSHSHLFKLSLAHAIAQSTKLSIYESTMQESLALTSSFPKELSMTGHLHLERKEALKITGRLWKLRMDVNLIGGILDTPELFWSEASLFPLYEAIREYLEIGPRVQVLNDRLSVAGDLTLKRQLEIIHEYIEERATHRITWIIIWLIVIACMVEAGEVVARVVFHNLPRESGELLVVKGTKAILGVGSVGSL